MRIILELDENDIADIFKDSWLADQIPPRLLDATHFKDIVRERWYEASEVWFKTRIPNFKITLKSR